MNELTLNAERTMSSREIAELVESRHDSVKRTIERLAVVKQDGTSVIQLPPLVDVTNGQGQTVAEYRVGKRDSYIIVAQLSPEFTARLVDRWQALEAQLARPAINLNDPAFLRTVLLEYTEKVLELQQTVEAQKPAVEFVERYTHADGNKGFREVAKLLNANERDFRAFLISHNVMYRLNGRLAAHAHHQHAGRFAVRTGIGDNEHAFTQAMFTSKGIEWVAGKWAAYRLQTEAA